MKTLLWLGLFIAICSSSSSQAENYYSPLLCPVGESFLRIENASGSIESFWFQTFGSSPFFEKHYELGPKETRVLAIGSDYTADSSAIAIKTHNENLKFTAFCKTKGRSWQLEKLNSPWKSLKIPPQSKRISFHLLNLAQIKNNISIEFEFLPGQTQSLPLSEGFATNTIEVLIPQGARRILLRGQGRWTGKAFSELLKEIPLQDEVQVLQQASAYKYFLFQSPGGNDSFVVPMDNPKLIEQTLEQIRDPQKRRLLVARIGKSLEGTNRDMLSAVKTPWSWSVVEAQNYADFAHISCDGTPSVVEERLNEWLINTGGTICFWNFRVVRELSHREIMQSPWSSPLDLESLRHKH